MGKFVEKTLSNGLKVYFYNEPEMHSVEIKMFVKTGQAFEKQEEQGLNHYTEHMLFAGTEKYPKKGQTMDTIWELGGYINGRTGFDISSYPIKVLEEDIDTAIDVLYEELAKPLIKEDLFEDERKVIIQEVRRGEDQPRGHMLNSLVPEVCYTLDSLRGHPAGSEENVKSFTYKQIKDNYKKVYNASNMALLIVSKLDNELLLKKVERTFGKIRKGEENKIITSQTPIKEKVIIEKRPLKQINSSFAFQVPGYVEENFYPFAVLARVLNKKLYKKIRMELQIAYDANVMMEVTSLASKVFSLTPVNKEKLVESVKATIEILEETKKDIEDELFRYAKNTFLANELFAEENPAKRAQKAAAKSFYLGRLETPEERIKNIESVTKEDVLKLANEYLTKEKLGWAFLGDIDEKTEKGIRELLS